MMRDDAVNDRVEDLMEQIILTLAALPGKKSSYQLLRKAILRSTTSPLHVPRRFFDQALIRLLASGHVELIEGDEEDEMGDVRLAGVVPDDSEVH